MIIIFRNARVWDGHSSDTIDGACVVVENDRIQEVGSRYTAQGNTQSIDCGGRVLMPGLIDAHFHACSPSVDIFGSGHLPSSLMANHAAKALAGALKRGFTSVRDAGGGDIGLALAIEQGLIMGPRFFFAGKMLSQTGGHGDFRQSDRLESCSCSSYSGSISLVVDGPDAVRLAAREQLRKGANQIKICITGGLSAAGPISMNQFSSEEVRAAVEEAATRDAYVMAHCHTDEGARRSVELGIRTIEHGSYINQDTTAELIRERGAYVVPTLSVANVFTNHGVELGLDAQALSKLKGLEESMHRSIEVCSRAGVKLGLGTDLFGHQFHSRQGGEFELRGRSSKNIDVLRSATSINAEILKKSSELGCIRPGAYADLLVMEGDPLKDLSLFKSPEANMPVVMKGGSFVRNSL